MGNEPESRRPSRVDHDPVTLPKHPSCCDSRLEAWAVKRDVARRYNHSQVVILYLAIKTYIIRVIVFKAREAQGIYHLSAYGLPDTRLRAASHYLDTIAAITGLLGLGQKEGLHFVDLGVEASNPNDLVIGCPVERILNGLRLSDRGNRNSSGHLV